MREWLEQRRVRAHSLLVYHAATRARRIYIGTAKTAGCTHLLRLLSFPEDLAVVAARKRNPSPRHRFGSAARTQYGQGHRQRGGWY